MHCWSCPRKLSSLAPDALVMQTGLVTNPCDGWTDEEELLVINEHVWHSSVLLPCLLSVGFALSLLIDHQNARSIIGFWQCSICSFYVKAYVISWSVVNRCASTLSQKLILAHGIVLCHGGCRSTGSTASRVRSSPLHLHHSPRTSHRSPPIMEGWSGAHASVKQLTTGEWPWIVDLMRGFWVHHVHSIRDGITGSWFLSASSRSATETPNHYVINHQFSATNH